MADIGKILGKNIRNLRLKKGLSAKTLAERINKKQSYISRLENGLIKNPRMETMREIINGLESDEKKNQDFIKNIYTSFTCTALESDYEPKMNKGVKNKVKSNYDFIQIDVDRIKKEICQEKISEDLENTELIFGLSTRKELALELLTIADELKNNGAVLLDRKTYNPLSDTLKTHLDNTLRRLELYIISYNLYTENLIKEKVENR